MSKFTYATILFLIGFLPFRVDAQLSNRLAEAIEAHPNSLHRIRIEFKDNVDCYALNHTFKQQRLAVSERPKTVITQLQQQADVSQSDILEMLRTELADQTRNIQPFWIVNIIVLEATSEAIQTIAEFPQVALIDIEDSRILPHDPIIRGEEQNSRSVDGVEPGLVAINAPGMWALGYTGRGRLVYDYDTGVWPTHPAFAERFMAHRYPLSQCWHGFFSNVPNGNVSDHGTHTLGTMTGLVEQTNDTIGVAFGSYWIANDFVTTTVEALPPLTDMIGAFQWALNPDGDINTSDDIPDVINNSWRWRDDPDTVQCAGMIVSLMNAIEAAGIANVFSGGNSGPNNTTVNAPQRINTSEVNTFSVGSVNGNLPFPYPISNFSTRGPTQCPSNGNSSLEIHPEVVAPGQNVRSAWATDGYNTISGTSMAAPHVSGALLLLKEAFPYLSGEELLWALYLTAVDLGDTGEDNTYGMGIIDVYAAFQYLAQTNTPVDPNAVAWDIAIKMETTDNGIICGNSISPAVVISNLGDSTISSAHFDYNINGGSGQTFDWSGTLLPGATATVSLPTITTSDYGELGLSIVASIPNHPNEYDLYNNHWYYKTDRREPTPLPFVEDFDHGFGLHDWLVQNEDGGVSWDTVVTSGLDWNEYSASVQMYSYLPRANQKDGLVSPLLQLPATTEQIWLLFDLAYQKWSQSASSQDTFAIQVSTDCGDTFQEVYRKYGDELSTSDTIEPNFLPEFAWNWRRDSVNLSAFADSDVLLRFETANRKGNNLYIDNVKVFVGNTEPAGITDLSAEVKLYPNPANETVYVALTRKWSTSVQMQLFNMLGERIETISAAPSDRIAMDVSELDAGLYFLQVTVEGLSTVKRFVKQ
ncbi:MAG: S8 family serine peptidase [Flavobacteriales bacterium]|nr:S8 family serine peptidase [Flavobacteriales bacterium]